MSQSGNRTGTREILQLALGLSLRGYSFEDVRAVVQFGYPGAVQTVEMERAIKRIWDRNHSLLESIRAGEVRIGLDSVRVLNTLTCPFCSGAYAEVERRWLISPVRPPARVHRLPVVTRLPCRCPESRQRADPLLGLWTNPLRLAPGMKVRYVVPDTQRTVWEGIVLQNVPKARCVKVRLATSGYENLDEWVMYDHIIAISGEKGSKEDVPF